MADVLAEDVHLAAQHADLAAQAGLHARYLAAQADEQGDLQARQRYTDGEDGDQFLAQLHAFSCSRFKSRTESRRC
ncbi:MAG: hypothetical protein F4X13_02480 [Gammaproteobacteria bacterium]|nr:hypothetical protein [Gammaproteobacteria bacterium]